MKPSVSNGDAAKPGGGSWSNFSDARRKRDITPLAPGLLDRLLSLNGYGFEYNADAVASRLELPGRQIGLIAQEVQRVFPDWVDADAERYLYVTKRGLTAIVVEALRELRAEKDAALKALRAEYEVERNALRAENHELRERPDRIEARVSQRMDCAAVAEEQTAPTRARIPPRAPSQIRSRRGRASPELPPRVV